MNHCSSEGATVGIQSYLSSRLKFQFKTTISKPKTIAVQFQIKIHFDFISKFFLIHFKNQIKMQETIHLSDLWEHTITKVFKCNSKSKLGLMFKQWIIFHKLENFNSILNYPIDDFAQSGNLCYMNKHVIFCLIHQ